jgi:UDP-2-acetamido-2-deoxy-ribo-hexuluronate aminotransferase
MNELPEAGHKIKPMEFIDLKAQYRHLKTAIDARIQSVLNHGQYILGPEIRELEERLAARTGAKYCISCSSGTDALLLALMALGVQSGDEVVTAPFTFFATGEMIALLGAVPVFADIDPATYNLDPARIEAAITPRTRAIMPIGLYGQPADMDAINAIAARHNLAVIEDAAQSFGALYKERHSGNLSTIGCTSFFPSKPLGCYGDGGACFTNDDALSTAMFELRNHGQDRRYHPTRIGINGRMDTIQAAVLLAKLEVFDAELIARNEVADRYAALLKGIVETPKVVPHSTSVWAQYTVEVDDRESVEKAMRFAGIPTAVHYPTALHLQPVFAELSRQRGWTKGSFPISEDAAARVLSLPMHPYQTPSDAARICNALQEGVHARPVAG